MVTTQNNPYLGAKSHRGVWTEKLGFTVATIIRHSPRTAHLIKLQSDLFWWIPNFFSQTDILIHNCWCNRDQFCQWHPSKSNLEHLVVHHPCCLILLSMHRLSWFKSTQARSQNQNCVIIGFPWPVLVQTRDQKQSWWKPQLIVLSAAVQLIIFNLRNCQQQQNKYLKLPRRTSRYVEVPQSTLKYMKILKVHRSTSK